jgi:hypothetical protein
MITLTKPTYNYVTTGPENSTQETFVVLSGFSPANWAELKSHIIEENEEPGNTGAPNQEFHTIESESWKSEFVHSDQSDFPADWWICYSEAKDPEDENKLVVLDTALAGLLEVWMDLHPERPERLEINKQIVQAWNASGHPINRFYRIPVEAPIA